MGGAFIRMMSREDRTRMLSSIASHQPRLPSPVEEVPGFRVEGGFEDLARA